MRLVCPQCSAAFDVSDRRPSFCPFCGKPMPADDPSATAPHDAATEAPQAPCIGGEIPEQVGGYRLGRLLGRGGMGAVYEAENTTGRRVAVKLLAPEFASSESAVERFRREGQLASRIIHPRCVFVLAADEDAGRPFIVMELMPGETLKDVVAREGPLPPARAVGLILDVLEGLRETHRLGLIHRDVKPSNCFLQADGRVKIGDFGLSKSLAEASELTGTGTFVGTVLFASPEQVRKEALDARTDVYSAAATLYYLLTGRAPFESDDAMATLARIVSDDPPPLREARTDVPAELDHAVMRGLARDRPRRWQSVDDFESALAPFMPGHHLPARLLVRFGAQLMDYFIYTAAMYSYLVAYWARFGEEGETPFTAAPLLANVVFSTVWLALYFGVLEWRWGCSPGKYLVRLRVRQAGGAGRPGFFQNLARTAVWYAVIYLLAVLPDLTRPDPQPWYWDYLTLVTLVLSVLVLVAPMRRRNGYRGLHEWLSGTCVVALAPRELMIHTRAAVAPTLPPVRAAEDLPPTVGPYVVTGAWPAASTERVVLAEDAKLQRAVCVWIREAPQPTSPARRELSRPARLRWLADGEIVGRRWDAFAAPSGRPLVQMVREQGPLTWGELRPLLKQLAEELDAAGRDGTLPPSLSLEQVWVRPGGLELLDFRPGLASASRGANPGELLRDVVMQSLGVSGSGEGLRMAPVPIYAGRIVRKILGEELPYGSAAEVVEDLAAVAGQAAAVSRGVRAMHLLTVGTCLILGHLVGFGTLLEVMGAQWLVRHWLTIFPLLLMFWVVWGGVWQGGLGLRLFGLALAGPDGQVASPERCALRSFLAWAPYIAVGIELRVTDIWLTATYGSEAAGYFAARTSLLRVGVMVSLPFLYLALGLVRPQRSLFDWLAGTYVVPK